jgi:DNA-binding response OmpR family regulator
MPGMTGMTGMTGMEMVTLLRQGGSDTPVIAMTGFSEHDERAGVTAGGTIAAVLYKPFKMSEIAGTVEKVLKNIRRVTCDV